MLDLVIIPCGARKVPHRSRAGNLYTGPYFRACLRYALSLTAPERVFILSAKYGLLALSDEVDAYNLTMGQPGSVTITQVRQQAKERGIDGLPCVAVGGRKYTDFCRAVWRNTKTPLTGVGGNGKQLQWLKQHRGVMP